MKVEVTFHTRLALIAFVFLGCFQAVAQTPQASGPSIDQPGMVILNVRIADANGRSLTGVADVGQLYYLD